MHELMPLAPSGGTDSWCGWSAGDTPEAYLGQMYLTLFLVLVLMRDALYLAFGACSGPGRGCILPKRPTAHSPAA